MLHHEGVDVNISVGDDSNQEQEHHIGPSWQRADALKFEAASSANALKLLRQMQRGEQMGNFAAVLFEGPENGVPLLEILSGGFDMTLSQREVYG